MHAATHLLVSWTMADSVRLDSRDRKLVTWCGVLPDLDGAGMLLDGFNWILGRSSAGYYAAYHHGLFHGLFGIVLFAALLACFATRRRQTFLWALAVGHVHLLCDSVGSRGPHPVDIWPVSYLAPFSDLLRVQWSGQWPINGWPNILLTLAVLAVLFVRACRRGYSVVGLFSDRADRVFVETVRRRWALLRGTPRSRK